MSDEKIIVNVDPDLEELIPGFLENRGKDLDALRSALTDGNCPTMQSIGHSLKGVGGGYGFNGLSEIGADIESAAKVQDMNKLGELVELLADYMGRIEVKFE